MSEFLTYPKYITTSEWYTFISEIVGFLIKLYLSQNIIIMKLLNRNALKFLLKQDFMCFCEEIVFC
jgi:hypothetical protein